MQGASSLPSSKNDDLRLLLSSARAKARASIAAAAACNTSTPILVSSSSSSRPPRHGESFSFSRDERDSSLPKVGLRHSSSMLVSARQSTPSMKARSSKPKCERADNRDECPICLQPLLDATKTNCGHSFCFMCVFHVDVATCPICRAPISAESGDFALDFFADLCVKIKYPNELNRRRESMRRFTERLGTAQEILEQCATAIAEDRRNRCADGRLVAEVKFRSRMTNFAECKSQDVAVAAQQMTFSGGFMRRRAPSIVVISSGDSPRGLPANFERPGPVPWQLLGMSPRARNGQCGVVVRPRPEEASALPYTVDVDGEDTAVKNDLPTPTGTSRPLNEDEENDAFSTPRLAKQGLLSTRPQCTTTLPRLPSADTRLNQEMRSLIKRQSLAAAAKASKNVLTRL